MSDASLLGSDTIAVTLTVNGETVRETVPARLNLVDQV